VCPATRRAPARTCSRRAVGLRPSDEEDPIIPNSTLVQSTVARDILRDSEYRPAGIAAAPHTPDMRRVPAARERAAPRDGRLSRTAAGR
jgi:hypothetical protein